MVIIQSKSRVLVEISMCLSTFNTKELFKGLEDYDWRVGKLTWSNDNPVRYKATRDSITLTYYISKGAVRQPTSRAGFP